MSTDSEEMAVLSEQKWRTARDRDYWQRVVVRVYLLPMIVVLALFAVSAVFVGRVDRQYTQSSESTQALENSAALEEYPADRERYASGSLATRVSMLASNIEHVAAGLPELPGESVTERFDVLSGDWKQSRALLAAADFLKPGEDTLAAAVGRAIGRPGTSTPTGGACPRCEVGDPPYAVYFNIGRSGLTPASRERVAAIAERWRNSGTRRLTVQGYADRATGGCKINQRLALRRAQAVAEALRTAVGASAVEMRDAGDCQSLPSYRGFRAEAPEYQRAAVIGFGDL